MIYRSRGTRVKTRSICWIIFILTGVKQYSWNCDWIIERFGVNTPIYTNTFESSVYFSYIYFKPSIHVFEKPKHQFAALMHILGTYLQMSCYLQIDLIIFIRQKLPSLGDGKTLRQDYFLSTLEIGLATVPFSHF